MGGIVCNNRDMISGCPSLGAVDYTQVLGAAPTTPSPPIPPQVRSALVALCCPEFCSQLVHSCPRGHGLEQVRLELTLWPQLAGLLFFAPCGFQVVQWWLEPAPFFSSKLLFAHTVLILLLCSLLAHSDSPHLTKPPRFTEPPLPLVAWQFNLEHQRYKHREWESHGFEIILPYGCF